MVDSRTNYSLNRLCTGVHPKHHCTNVVLRTPYIAVLNELSIGDYIDHKQKQSGGYYLRSGMRATSVRLDDLKLHRRKAKRLLLVDTNGEKCVMRLFARLRDQVQEHHS